MKGYLVLLSLLLLSAAASAQIPDSATGHRRLDRETERWHLKFGLRGRRFHRLKDRAEWDRHPEKHKLGPFGLEYPTHFFSEDGANSRLYLVLLKIIDTTATSKNVRPLLQARYGPPNRLNGSSWAGARVFLRYREPGKTGTGLIVLSSTTIPRSLHPQKYR